MAGTLFAPRAGRALGGRDPRLLVVALLLFAAVTVSLRSLPAAAVAVLLAAGLTALNGMRPLETFRRLLVLEGMMLVLLLTLPFTTAGDAVVDLGPLTATRQGLHHAVLIALKANAVVLALLGLIGGLEPAALGHALARLRVPEKLVHLLLLTVRQIELTHQELGRLRRAMRARAFRPGSNRHTWISYSNLIGMLLVRSLDRSRRLLAAMRCRGFDGRLYLLDAGRWQAGDTLVLIALVPLLLSLLVLDRVA